MLPDDTLRQRVLDAIANLPPADRADRISRLPQDITLAPDYRGYFNTRVTTVADTTFGQEATHFKFTPLVKEGCLIMQPAETGEKGAVTFKRSHSRHAGEARLLDALIDFNLRFPRNHNLRLPVMPLPLQEGETGPKVLIIQVTDSTSVKRATRSKALAPPPPAI